MSGFSELKPAGLELFLEIALEVFGLGKGWVTRSEVENMVNKQRFAVKTGYIWPSPALTRLDTLQAQALEDYIVSASLQWWC